MGVGAAVAGAAVAGVAGSVVSSSISANGAKSAAKTEANAENQASAQQQVAGQQANALTTQKYQQDYNLLEPYTTDGNNANAQLNLITTNPAAFQQQFMASPGYQYNLQQSQGAIQNSAAASGGLVGGNTLMALQKNASGLASQDYDSYVNQLMNLQGTGLQANSALANLGTDFATNYSNNLLGTATNVSNDQVAGANSVAAGQTAAANATSGAISNATSTVGNSLNNYLLYSSLSGAGGLGNAFSSIY